MPVLCSNTIFVWACNKKMTSLATSFVAGAAQALLVFSVCARCLAVVVRIKQVTSKLGLLLNLGYYSQN
jgi:hypothetical protein